MLPKYQPQLWPQGPRLPQVTGRSLCLPRIPLVTRCNFCFSLSFPRSYVGQELCPKDMTQAGGVIICQRWARCHVCLLGLQGVRTWLYLKKCQTRGHLETDRKGPRFPPAWRAADSTLVTVTLHKCPVTKEGLSLVRRFLVSPETQLCYPGDSRPLRGQTLEAVMTGLGSRVPSWHRNLLTGGAWGPARGCYLPSRLPAGWRRSLPGFALLESRHDIHCLILPVKPHFSSRGKRGREALPLASLRVDQSWPWKPPSLGSPLAVGTWPDLPPRAAWDRATRPTWLQAAPWSSCPFPAVGGLGKTLPLPCLSVLPWKRSDSGT